MKKYLYLILGILSLSLIFCFQKVKNEYSEIEQVNIPIKDKQILLNNISSFCVSKEGEIFIADPNNKRIIYLNSIKGVETKIIKIDNEFAVPHILKFSKNNNLYVLDKINYEIYKIDFNSGKIILEFDEGVYTGSEDFIINDDDEALLIISNLFGLNANFSELSLIEKSGKTNILIDFNAIGKEFQNFSPNCIIKDKEKAIYFLEPQNERIIQIKIKNNIINEYTILDKKKLNLKKPQSISIDKDDKIYIADTGNNRIIKIDDIYGSNAISFDGLNKNENKKFNRPTFITIGEDNRIYVLDSNNSRIIVFDDMIGNNWIEY